MVQYKVRPSELIIDTNKDCVVAVDTPWLPPAQKTCVWEGHLNAPENAESLTFYISIEGDPNVGTSKKSFKLEVWDGSGWKELFYKELTAIEGGQETTMSEKPGELIYKCSGSGGSPCYGKYEYWYACETEADLPEERDPEYVYTCVKYPNCLNLPRDGYNRYFCTMPKITLDKKYIINGQVRFRSSATLLQGSGDTYMDPLGSEAISIYGVMWEIRTFDIKVTIHWTTGVPNHGVTKHIFYLFSFFGKDTDGTIEGFQIEKGTSLAITTPSMTRVDELITEDVSQFDLLMIIAENSDGSGVYDWIIDRNVI